MRSRAPHLTPSSSGDVVPKRSPARNRPRAAREAVVTPATGAAQCKPRKAHLATRLDTPFPKGWSSSSEASRIRTPPS